MPDLYKMDINVITPVKAIHALEDIHDIYTRSIEVDDRAALFKIADWIRLREQPIIHFKHDCKGCLFLGHYIPPKGNRYDYDCCDIYYCSKQIIGGSTIVARAGDEDDNFISGMPTRAQFYEENYWYPPCQGYRWAKERGLEVPELY